jgi:hypothetical protein
VSEPPPLHLWQPVFATGDFADVVERMRTPGG